eukprot:CAMPEP_0114987490 /NCGR_PEP_ID=MMETSP0216-20121206/9038_1 /TAXON_ID=223996 /ORGANISM="Protocruzia adherens, Strain Boccale" /LENGTH=402 /DNA_ID=CAMNT_0002350097 /DNA_START=44 /DNA_END=1252 /DNA_ORIENTATION=+
MYNQGQQYQQQGNPALDAALDNSSYHYSTKGYIRSQAYTVLSQTPTLKPISATYTYNDGSSDNLLCLEGTLDTAFRTKIYHFPVRVYLTRNFPQSAPMCYVNPTQNMYINPKATYINPDGSITLQYLNYWNQGTTSSLNGLLAQMRLAFGNTTPLFERQNQGGAGGAGGQQFGGYGAQGAGGAAGGMGYGGQGGMGGGNAGQYGGGQGMQQQRGGFGDVRGGYQGGMPGGAGNNPPDKNIYVQQITPKLREKIQESLDKYSLDLERLQKETAKLKENRDRNEQHRGDLEQRLKEVEEKTQSLTDHNSKLAEWIDENNEMTLADKDVNDILVADDPLSGQILELLATNIAIEDCMYTLEQVHRKNGVTLDDYLKGIRELARRQCKNMVILGSAMEAQQARFDN